MSNPASDTNLEIINIPLFPLPNVVFFPKTVLPLHIFEPRYRQMVGDVLEGGRQIGMVLMKDEGQLGVETWHSVGGVGEITELRRLEEGKLDILLRGLSRFRIIELVRQAPYRVARVHLMDEAVPGLSTQSDLSGRLIDSFLTLIRELPHAFDPEILKEFDFSTLVNSICSTIQIDDMSKQALLEIDCLKARAQELLQILDRLRSQQKLVSQFDHLRPDDSCLN